MNSLICLFLPLVSPAEDTFSPLQGYEISTLLTTNGNPKPVLPVYISAQTMYKNRLIVTVKGDAPFVLEVQDSAVKTDVTAAHLMTHSCNNVLGLCSPW